MSIIGEKKRGSPASKYYGKIGFGRLDDGDGVVSLISRNGKTVGDDTIAHDTAWAEGQYGSSPIS